MEISKPVGIDLGTTNSCVGIMNDTDSEIILYKNKMGVSTTPSCIWHDTKKNKIVVGKMAFRRRGSRPEPIVSIKRKMGTMLLTPLGKRNDPPENIPETVRKVLFESRDERLTRYLDEIVEEDQERQEEKRKKARNNPSELWVLDQDARLDAYLKTVAGEEEKKAMQADPPLLWLPEEVSALILVEEQRKIIESLEKSNSDNTYRVNRAVITIPAYFGTRQVNVTKEAGRLAGLRVLELLQEPTAAAIYYTWKDNIQDGNFMVFDLGGGTFDVSIVRRTAGQYEALGISGNNFLGGDDMDNVLARWICECVIEEDPDYELSSEPETDEDRRIFKSFILLAEGVKKNLSAEAETWLRDTNTVKDRKGDSVSIEIVVNRDNFDELIRPIVWQCMPKCWEALARAKKRADISLRDIDQIFLVGGSTHVPLVSEMVRGHFCTFEGARSYEEEEIEVILADINGDDEEETNELRQIAGEMIKSNAKAKSSEPLKEEVDLCVSMGASIKAAGHGVTTREEGTGVRIEFMGARGTSGMKIPIKGKVVTEDDTDLTDAEIRLINEPLGVEEEISLNDDGTFVFKGVPLQERAQNQFEILVISDEDETIGRSTISIEQSSDYSEVPTEDLSKTTLSKAIYLDVLKQGKVVKKVLIESGATLPAEESHTLKVPDPNIGDLKFRIYQAKQQIANVQTDIDPSLQEGTPVNVVFSISEDHKMVCRYQIGENPNWESFVIEPPPPPKIPTSEEVRRLNDQITEALSYKAVRERRTCELRAEKINPKLEQAMAAGDDPKVLELYEELQALYEEAQTVKAELKPTWDEFEALLAQCRKMIDVLEKKDAKFQAAEARKSLDAQRREARNAFDDKDQQRYGEYHARVQQIAETLREKIEGQDGQNQDVDPVTRCQKAILQLLEQATAFIRAAADLAAQFGARAENPPSDEEPDLSLKYRQQCLQCEQDAKGAKAVLEKLQSQCADDSQGVMSECQSLAYKLDKCRTILVAKYKFLAGKDGAPLPEDGILQE